MQITEIGLGGVPRGAVIVLCDTEQLTEAAEVMNGLAEHGYESSAADLSDCGRVNGDPIQSVGALLSHLGERGWEHEQLGILGYGYGGWLSLRAEAAYTLGAAVSIAPAQPAGAEDTTTRALATLQTPWIAMTAAQDASGVADTLLGVDEMRYSQVAVYTEVVRYPGVPEAFYRESVEGVAHAAAFDSWQRTIEWLNLRVVPRLTARPRRAAWARRSASLIGEC